MIFEKMNNVENSIGYLGTLDINQQGNSVSPRYKDLTEMISTYKTPNRTISVSATGIIIDGLSKKTLKRLNA